MGKKQKIIEIKQENKMHVKILIRLFFLIMLFINFKAKEKKILEYKKSLKRMQKLYAVANHWLSLEICHRDFMKLLLNKKYKKIVIYGIGELGKRLIEKIEVNENVDVLYGIDRNADDIQTIIPVYCLEEVPLINSPDAVILTTYCENKTLSNKLQEKFQCPVINIEELLDETK